LSWERKDDRSRRKEELIELGKEGRLEPEKGRIKRDGEKRMNGGGKVITNRGKYLKDKKIKRKI